MVQDIEHLKEVILHAINKEVGKRKLSQSAFGRLCGLDRVLVNKALRGTERYVGFQKLVRMANALDLEVNIKVSKKRSTANYKKATGSVGRKKHGPTHKNRAF